MNKDFIIKSARQEMRYMLESVYNYNSSFIKDEEDEGLLERILFDISLVDRKFFTENPYVDTALPIGKGQTISQPSTVARMLLLSELKQGDGVLEIGAGSGWNACLISWLVYPGSVLSVERVYELKEKAERNFSKFKDYLKQERPNALEKFSKLNFQAVDVFSNKINKKFDKIIFTAGITDKEQGEMILKIGKGLLKQNGILVCPYTLGPMLIYKKGKRYRTKEEYVFVPLLEGVEK